MMADKIPLLVTLQSIDDYLPRLEEAGYRVIQTSGETDREKEITAHGHEIRAVLTRGGTGFTAEEMDAIPNLGIISTLGAGYENIDREAAAARGIPVTHSPGLNAPAVADHAMALLLAIVHDIPRFNAKVKGYEWARWMHPTVSGKRLGILGLGNIGREIARRAEGFGMRIGYHGRSPQSDVAYRYFDTALAMAEDSDFVVVATPGGTGTRHLVNADVLRALGPEGYLVNIARGGVVDTDALFEALRENGIAGAGLDVVEGEPEIPPGIADLPTLVITPHVGGRSPEAVAATVQRVIENFDAHFAGRPLLSPVPMPVLSSGRAG